MKHAISGGKGPDRVRSRAYMASVRGKPCLVCGSPGEAHHLQRAQPRALGRKTGDNYVVPVCRACHLKIHAFGDETTWWALRGVDPIEWAETNWERWSDEKG
jgi:hypothetical protein